MNRINRLKLKAAIGLFMFSFIFAVSCFSATITIDSPTAAAGAANISVPISLSLTRGDEVSGLIISISYDSSGLIFQNLEIGNETENVGKNLVTNSPSDGVLKMVLYSMTPTDFIQNGILCNLVFDVAAGVSDGQMFNIEITECDISDGNAKKVHSRTKNGRIFVYGTTGSTGINSGS